MAAIDPRLNCPFYILEGESSGRASQAGISGIHVLIPQTEMHGL
jgi:hypothetical protein